MCFIIYLDKTFVMSFSFFFSEFKLELLIDPVWHQYPTFRCTHQLFICDNQCTHFSSEYCLNINYLVINEKMENYLDCELNVISKGNCLIS